MKIKKLIKTLGSSAAVPSLKDFNVSGISCNSKDVKDDFIFVAVKGSRYDGNKFLNEAIKNGAKAVVVSVNIKLPGYKNIYFIKVKDTRIALAKLAVEFYANPSAKIKVIGVTGTNGKTTITYLLEAILKKHGKPAGVIGTVNCRFKDKVIPSKNTTPGALLLQSMLADMLREGLKYACMEVSSHALDQGRVEGVNFHSAIFTNLTQDHLDYHKTLNNYFKAKARLFKDIPSGSFVALNNDDRYSAKLRKITGAKVVTYGIDNKADCFAADIKYSVSYTAFRLISPIGETNLKINLIGKHNIYNILAACAWAQKEGIYMRTIKSAVEGFSLVPGRLERISFNGDFSVFVDYAHTDDALKNVILSLRNISANKIIVVFGCGGERDRVKRPKMGRIVTELSDYAIITSDNPRREAQSQIFQDIKKGITKDNYCIIPERYDAIKKSLSLASAGDIVLVAGKGHENYQIIRDKAIAFDDREVVKECLKSAKY